MAAFQEGIMDSGIILNIINVILLATERSAALECFSCHGVADINDCSKTKVCRSDEHCHIKEYYNPGGTKLFDLDCQTLSTCTDQEVVNDTPPDQTVDMWTSCCSTDYCNKKFKSDGTPVRGSSSLIECYNCADIEDPADCSSKAVCKAGEVCVTSEFFADDGSSRHKMGCLAKRVCSFLGYYLPYGKRHSKRFDLCKGCCESPSLCNNKFCSKKLGLTGQKPLGSSVAPHPSLPHAATTPVQATTTFPVPEVTTTTTTTTTTAAMSTTTFDPFSTYHLVVHPQSEIATLGSSVNFQCLFDPPVSQKMTLTWYFETLTGSKHEVYTDEKDPPELSYFVNGIVVEDSGVYICEATFGIHKWRASGVLVV